MDDPLAVRAVASLLGHPAGDVTVVERTVVGYDAFQAGRRVARLRGTAVVEGARREWSLVEKVTDPPGLASAYLRALAHRELEAYRSGDLTDGVPGVLLRRACTAMR